MSYECTVVSGVIQGSVLGAILFLIYINDLPDNVVNSNISCFADDTRINKRISSVRDKYNLQKDINALVEWSTENNMTLHEKKFDFLIHSSHKIDYLQELPYQHEYHRYEASNTTLQSQKLVKVLGVIIAENLTWRTHISTTITNARKTSGWVLSVFKDSMIARTHY